jgi:cyclic pyranopterin phosphate synthase
MTKLADSFQRPLNYLRISVTDRCNLRCIYCMPPEGISLASHDDILRYEEIYLVAQAAAELGINKLRLTGGEPLVRANLTDLVSLLAKIPDIDDISMTTNGLLLERHAEALKKAGLHRVNVSLDSLHKARFRKITRVGKLDDVLRGIEAAKKAGLNPVKINMVVIRGMNDDEVHAFHPRGQKEQPPGARGRDNAANRDAGQAGAPYPHRRGACQVLQFPGSDGNYRLHQPGHGLFL